MQNFLQIHFFFKRNTFWLVLPHTVNTVSFLVTYLGVFRVSTTYTKIVNRNTTFFPTIGQTTNQPASQPFRRVDTIALLAHLVSHHIWRVFHKVYIYHSTREGEARKKLVKSVSFRYPLYHLPMTSFCGLPLPPSQSLAWRHKVPHWTKSESKHKYPSLPSLR